MAFWLKLDRALFRVVSGVAQILLLVAVAAGFWQVVTRFIFHSPADWTEILTRSVLIWAVFLGVVLAFRQGAMISVEVLRTSLPVRGRMWLERLTSGVCLAFLLFLAWIGAQMTYRVRFQTVPSLEISISWIYLAIPVGATLGAIAVLARWLTGEIHQLPEVTPDD